MSDPFLDLSEARLEVLKPDLFLEPFDRGLVSLHSPATSSSGLSGRDLQAHPNPIGRTAQPYPGIQQILVGPIPLVVGRTRDSASPTAGCFSGEGALTIRPLVVAAPPGVAEPTAPGEISAGQATRSTPTAHTTASSAGARRSRVRTLARVGGPSCAAAESNACSYGTSTRLVASHRAAKRRQASHTPFVQSFEPDRVLLMPDGALDVWSVDYLDLVALD